MSDDLLRKLRMLEADYPGQPIVVQQADLREINDLRSRLGMPPVDAPLKGVGAAVGVQAKPAAKAAPDHTEARDLYRAYLRKNAELEVHRAYAERVARATSGPGQTPVRPLATMGTDGGPLLCDHCRKPIVLEGGPFHGVAADVAWGRNPSDGWNSWIKGGMVVEIQTNGTLRIYHGYPGQGKGCCNVASRKDAEAREEFESRRVVKNPEPVLAFLEHEFPDVAAKARLDLLNAILDAMYSYDPGIGINHPGCTDPAPDGTTGD